MLGSLFSHQSILGTRIDATSYEDACDRIQTWCEQNLSCYIVAANVHVVMTGYWRKRYQRIINQAKLITPDGMPLVWGMRLLGMRRQRRVYGPDLMLAWCDRAAQLNIPLFLYGGTENTLQKLKFNLLRQFPDLTIVGTYAPPFRSLTPEEEARDRAMIESSGAKVVLVGLGCPKQEEWMSRQQGLQAVMIGVGAAFRFHSGEVSQSPRWMMQMGLEWLYRLVTEPKRLWRRYLINNPSFLLLFGLQVLHQKFKPVKNF
ncbi:glycosyltransferase [Aphanothece hegewaldii CCALA 016]|uniref:Glycosyltransferase n=1 Tax=Aphanothece hegewaldii CCALA 016 TaxID=2107694 RepID=A0A2T1LXZ4_9CHRO|nr:WecB/TagA/CpsF family glycosyltransferase [Aphanothece hegewaldii]PSF37246.1 glycosyltransferase [Aphanothece hegewaldii CCALA 016]